MKKFSLFILMLSSCVLFFAFTFNVNALDSKKTHHLVVHRHADVINKNRIKDSKMVNAIIDVYMSSNVSGNWVVEFNGSSGTSTFNLSSGSYTPCSVPYGTYYVGIHAISGSSASYTYSGSVCTNSYRASGTSALFSNVVINCGGGSFSIN